jgi:hypothetical protein
MTNNLTDKCNELAHALLEDVTDAYEEGNPSTFFHSLERFDKGARGLASMASYIEITEMLDK